MTHSDINKVLLIGGEGVGKKQLLASLLKGGFSSELVEEITHHSFDITTKYFSTSLNVWLVQSAAFTRSFGDAELINSLFAQCQAILLVFDATKRETFTKAQQWYKLLTTLSTKPDFCLCIANKIDLTDGTWFRQECMEWCIDNQFELIETNALLQSQVTEDGEEVGVSRIAQALHENVWHHVNPTAPAKKPAPQKQQQPPATAEESNTFSAEKDPSVTEEEKMIDDFEKQLVQLQQIKAHAAQLPMNERRTVAEQVALMFWKQLSANDGDDDGDIDDFKRIIAEADAEIAAHQKK